MGHEVHVVTRSKWVAGCNAALAEMEKLPLHIHGYELPPWALEWWEMPLRRLPIHYVLWQLCAYGKARQLHAAHRFDLVHHITFGVFRHPSLMGRLGVPFILGPLGGGDMPPLVLMRGAPWRALQREFLRWVGNCVATFDPLVISTFSQAKLIFCKTQETLEALPKRVRNKCMQQLEIATDQGLLAEVPSGGSQQARFLFVGNLLHLKGIHLILDALPKVLETLPGAKLALVGDGRDGEWLRGIAHKLGVDEAIEWVGRLPREKVLELYGSYTALVFPSLHDSSGNVVVEAMTKGLPVICLNIAGPGAIVPADCGIKIPARGCSEDEVVSALAEAMIRIASDHALRDELARNTLAIARQRTWDQVVRHAYERIEKALAAG